MVVLNKADLVDADTLAREWKAILRRDTRGGVKIVRADHGAVDVGVLLGLFGGG